MSFQNCTTPVWIERRWKPPPFTFWTTCPRRISKSLAASFAIFTTAQRTNWRTRVKSCSRSSKRQSENFNPPIPICFVRSCRNTWINSGSAKSLSSSFNVRFYSNSCFSTFILRENFAMVNVYFHKLSQEHWVQDSTYSVWSLACKYTISKLKFMNTIGRYWEQCANWFQPQHYAWLLYGKESLSDTIRSSLTSNYNSITVNTNNLRLHATPFQAMSAVPWDSS